MLLSFYEIKFSTCFDTLKENNFVTGNAAVFQDVDFVNGPPVAVQAGSTQTITLDASNKMERGVTYYIALRDLDKAGNAGPPSNIVSLLIPKPLPTSLISNTLVVIMVCSRVLLGVIMATILFFYIRKKFLGN